MFEIWTLFGFRKIRFQIPTVFILNNVSHPFQDHDNPNSVATSYFQSQSKLIKTQSNSTRGRPPIKKAVASSSDSEDPNADTTDLSSMELSLSDDEVKSSKNIKSEQKSSKTGKRSLNDVKKPDSTSKVGVILPGETNPNYIRKR